MIFVIFFWMCFEQAGVSLTFFAEEQTNRHIFGWEMPASYFQSFNAGFIIILAPIISAIWVRLARKGVNVSAPFKQSLGLAFLASGFLFIAFGCNAIPKEGASILFLTGLYFLHTVGELCLSPIGLSMVNKLTPGRFTSLMMGIWFLAIATGNKLAGAMSSLYPDPTNPVHPHLFSLEIDNLHTYFMIFVGFAGAAAFMLFLLSRKLQKMMHGIS
jgi:POT family proton-dependent oligopeptide transporter